MGIKKYEIVLDNALFKLFSSLKLFWNSIFDWE